MVRSRLPDDPAADSEPAPQQTARAQRGTPAERRYAEVAPGSVLAKAAARAPGGKPPTVDDVATATVESRGSGGEVPSSVRGPVEAQLGVDLSGVRVHGDDASREATAAMGARAFAHGSDVFLGRGESASDLGLMAHELTHVAQQGAAGDKAAQRLTVGAADSPAERQADAVAGQVTAGAAPAQLIIDSGDLQTGQMLRSTFMTQLRERVTAAAGDELGPVWSVAGCPYIDAFFARHQNSDARTVETMARRYSGLQNPQAAADYMPPICTRVRDGVRRWRDGEDVSGDLAQAGVSGPVPPPPRGTLGVVGDVLGLGALFKPDDPAAPPTAGALVTQLGPGEPLDAATASRMGSAFGGEDFSGVRVHTGAEAQRKVADADARALAVGEHVAFGAGEFRPGSPEGDAMLAHELAHTVQQRGAGGGEALARPVAAESGAHEEDADRAAVGVMGRLWGGVRAASERFAPALTSGFALQRCGGNTASAPAITDAFVLGLQAKLDAGDRVGFFNDIRGLGGSRAGDGAIRSGLQEFMRTGKLGAGEAFRAVALQELGPERAWAEVIRNFADGVDRGTFTVSGLAPAGADALREFCVRSAGEAAEGTADVRAQYRTRFNARWEVAPYAGLPSDLDPTLDSRGPRNQRARRIFTDLLAAEAPMRSAYDRNTPAGFRELCDTTAGPDGINLIASPRLQELRATLNPPLVTASGIADAAYTTLVGAVRPKAEALDARDRQELERQHQWRLAVDAKVSGPTDAATASLRSDLWTVVTTSRSAAPAVAPVPVAPPAPEPAPTLSAAQRDFLSGITIAPAAATVDASSDNQEIRFRVRSGRPNPALTVRRRVVVEPSAQVIDGGENEVAWPDASNSVDHTATVNPDAGGPASTAFTARLTMPPVPAADFAEKTATVTVRDKRLDWFKTSVAAGVTCVDENDFRWMNAGSSVHFKGGQVPIRVRPTLPGPNPGLTVFMEGELKRGAAVIHTFTRAPFPNSVDSAPLFDTILTESSPPAAGAESFEVKVNFFGAAGAAFHSVTLPFRILPNLPAPAGGDAARVAADNTWLNRPIGTPGLLEHMATSANVNWQRVAHAVNSHALKVEACMIRTDAATWLAAHGHDPHALTAYAMGAVTDARTLVAAPGAAGWRWGSVADTVFLNATPRAGHRRGLDELAEFLAHEGIHAADRTEAGTWGRYTTEFRAYWIMGVGAGESTAFDPSMDSLGPRSPRARAIFNHLYGSSTYPFVKPAYDGNVDRFRERADNYLYPDGINLTLSARLTELRTAIEGFSGAEADFPAARTLVTTKYGACDPGDRAEIRNNRMWRDLVEEKFPGTYETSPGPPPVRGPMMVPIKSVLGIP